jgi:hypothetical protein
MTIPQVQEKAANVNSVDNYRGITLNAIIKKTIIIIKV